MLSCRGKKYKVIVPPDADYFRPVGFEFYFATLVILFYSGNDVGIAELPGRAVVPIYAAIVPFGLCEAVNYTAAFGESAATANDSQGSQGV
jgi:hypothetical protein